MNALIRTALVATVLASGIAASAAAGVPYAKVCNGGTCLHHSNRLEGHTLFFCMSVRASPVTHYNVRQGLAQVEIPAIGAGFSGTWFFKNVQPGTRLTISIQACNRGFFGTSSCTPFRTVSFVAPKRTV